MLATLVWPATVDDMGLADIIASAGGKAAIEQIATRVGIPANVASQAVGMLLPSLSSGLERNTSSTDGLVSLLGALTKGGHARYVEQPESLATPEAVADGNGILGHILGGKDASRAVATTVASVLGIDNQTVKSMLPMVASMAMGGLAKSAKDSEITPEKAESSPGDWLGTISEMLGSGGAASIFGKLFS